jgi:hypothetical protein
MGSQDLAQAFVPVYEAVCALDSIQSRRLVWDRCSLTVWTCRTGLTSVELVLNDIYRGEQEP